MDKKGEQRRAGPKEWTRESPDKKPELLDAEKLLGAIGYAGAGTNLRVRVHSKKSEKSFEGIAKWRDDRVGGPTVIFRDDKNEESFIPLGGETVYLGGEAHKMSVDSMAKQFLYELL